MKIILTCGHPDSGYRLAHEALIGAGLLQAQPSKREEISPEELQAEIFKIHAPDFSGLPPGEQLSPSKECRELADDLFGGNVSRADWGWADSKTVWLLDFWKEFNPQIHFVLVYSAPELAVGRMLRCKVVTRESVDKAIASWSACNTEMLRFYNRNQDRCLLVNVSSVIHAPARFVEKTFTTFGLGSGRLPDDYQVDRGGVSSIASTLAKGLIKDCREAVTLYRELGSSADFDGDEELASEADPHQAWKEYRELLAGLEAMTEEVQAKDQRIDRLQRDLDKTGQSIKPAHRQLDEEVSKLDGSQASVGTEQSEITRLQARSAELAQENELQQLQLHLVQEELEHYFLRYQEIANERQEEAERTAACTRFWHEHQPDEIVIDMRGEIDGENWYYAERQGRWGGPGLVSSLRLPPLRSGYYEAQFDIVSTMAPEILADMTISLNGTPLEISGDLKNCPTIISAWFTTEKIPERPLWEFQFTFPKAGSPVQIGLEDQRELTINLRTLKLQFFNQPTEVVIDLRDKIDGDNWYHAEHDGRWAGPKRVSSLRMISPRSGRYEVQFYVVNAMTPEILAGMEVSLNGSPLNLSKDWNGYPALISSQFSTQEIPKRTVWEFQFEFPETVSPLQLGISDKRELAICLQSIKLQSID